MTIVLPVIAILSITGEWSQRTGLTTFTLVPHRGQVLLAKTLSAVVVGVAAMLVALVGRAWSATWSGTAITGTDLVWDLSAAQFGTIVVGSLLCLLTGTMLGMLLRSSPGALVAYFLMRPRASHGLRHPGHQPARTSWTSGPGSMPNFARSFLFEGPPTGEQWAQVAVTAALWLVLPALRQSDSS